MRRPRQAARIPDIKISPELALQLQSFDAMTHPINEMMRDPDPTRTQLDGMSGTTRRIGRRYVKHGTDVVIDRSKMRCD